MVRPVGWAQHAPARERRKVGSRRPSSDRCEMRHQKCRKSIFRVAHNSKLQFTYSVHIKDTPSNRAFLLLIQSGALVSQFLRLLGRNHHAANTAALSDRIRHDSASQISHPRTAWAAMGCARCAQIALEPPFDTRCWLRPVERELAKRAAHGDCDSRLPSRLSSSVTLAITRGRSACFSIDSTIIEALFLHSGCLSFATAAVGSKTYLFGSSRTASATQSLMAVSDHFQRTQHTKWMPAGSRKKYSGFSREPPHKLHLKSDFSSKIGIFQIHSLKTSLAFSANQRSVSVSLPTLL